MELLLANAGKVRRTTLSGREYLVAPMTLIVHGVLNGSKGSLYYPLQEISKEPGIWNHIPIVVYHPTINGENVSAKDPGVLDRSGIGILRNSKIDGDRLRAEGWFDVERTRKVDPRVLNALENNRSIELSTGLYTENEPAPMGANYKGVGYEFIARNYKPDHLAILPDQIGACGIRDGCGVLVNTHNTLESNSARVYRTASGKILFIDNCGGKGGKPGPCKGWKGISAVSATKATQTVKTPVTPLGPPSTKGKEPKTKAVEVTKTPSKATQKPKLSKVIEQHSIPQGTFGPSKAEIEFEGATHKKQMESLAKKFLGTKATTKDLASIAGAPDGATVRLEQGTRISDSVTVRFQGTHDGHEYNASRTIYRKDGELIVKNNIFHGKGVGIEVFGRQVENATRLGAKHIEMSAAGSFTPGPDPKKTYGDYNGYYTWPRMGVDDKVPSKSYSKLPPRLKKDVDKADGNVRGLMGTEKGRDWWLRNGTSLDHAKFDLKPGSYSQKTLASYLASRKGKGESTTSNMSKPKDNGQSNEIHQDDIDWDTLDAVNDHIGIKESKSNNSVTVGNTGVYRTASGKILLVDNINNDINISDSDNSGISNSTQDNYSPGDELEGTSVSPVELSSNSTRLERFIHWLIGNVSVENCGGKGGKPGPCPSGRKAYVPHPRQPAAPKPEIVKPPRARVVKPPTAPTLKPPTPTAKTPTKPTPVPKTPKPPVSPPTPAPAPKPTPIPPPSKGKGKEPSGKEPKSVSPSSKLLKSTVDDAHGHITDLLKNPDKITAKHVEETASKLMSLSAKDMRGLGDKLGITGLKGSDLKAKLAEKISKGALEGKGGSKDTGKGESNPSGQPIKQPEATKPSDLVKPTKETSKHTVEKDDGGLKITGAQLEKGNVKRLKTGLDVSMEGKDYSEADIQQGSSTLHKVEVGGKTYLVKDSSHGLDQSTAKQKQTDEVLTEKFARLAGVNAPRVAGITFQGKHSLASEWLDGKSVADFSDKKEALNRVPKDEIGQHIAFSFLNHTLDRQPANYFISKDNHLYTIDHEGAINLQESNSSMGFTKSDSSMRATSRKIIEDNALLSYGTRGKKDYDIPLPKKDLEKMIAAVPKMKAELEKHGRSDEAKQLVRRSETLEDLLKEKNPTVKSLLMSLDYHESIDGKTRFH